MNKQEILAEISELKDRLNKLEKMYDSLTPPYKRWRAEKDDDYYFIRAEGIVCFDRENEAIMDNSRYELGNYFETREEAEFEVERLKVIAELKEWATPPTDFDWDNNNRKYILEVRSTTEKCFLAIDYDYVYQLSDLYFRTKEQAENAIKAIGEDKIIKYYFRR